MAGTLTDPRVVSDSVIGLDWQASEGEAVGSAPFTPKQFIVCQTVSDDPSPSYIQPDGTHGGFFRRVDGTRISSLSFKNELSLMASRHQLAPFFESLTSGLVTVADADITETGDTAASFSAYTLTGVRPYHNTQQYSTIPAQSIQIFLKVEEQGGPASGYPVDVTAYRDAGLTDAVTATTTIAGAGAITLNPVAGGTLTIDVTNANASTETVTLTIDKLTFNFANQYTRFFKFYYTDGEELRVFNDCAVESMSFESSEESELMASVSILSKRRTIFSATTLSIVQTILDLVTYAHPDNTTTKDPGGTPVTPALDSVSVAITNQVAQYLGNSLTPQKIIKQGWTEVNGNLSGELSDETQGMIQDARDNTAAGGGIKDYRIDYLLAGKTMRFDLNNVRMRLTEPGIEDQNIGKASLEYDAHSDGTDNAVDITVEL